MPFLTLSIPQNCRRITLIWDLYHISLKEIPDNYNLPSLIRKFKNFMKSSIYQNYGSLAFLLPHY